jgi:hypothetical protein
MRLTKVYNHNDMDEYTLCLEITRLIIRAYIQFELAHFGQLHGYLTDQLALSC